MAVNQGELVVVAEGTEYASLTDDPETQLEDDATAIVLECVDTGAGELYRCLEELDLCKDGSEQCQASLGACQGEVAACGVTLSEARAESAVRRDRLPTR